MTAPLAHIRHRLVRLGDLGRRRAPLLRRVPRLAVLLTWTARIGYAARGLVYLSVGLVTLLAATDPGTEAVGPRDMASWLADQPYGQVWLILLGLGLCAFIGWRILQAVFDADHEGTSRDGVKMRISQGFSALTYTGLAASAFVLATHAPADPLAHDVAASHRQAAGVLALPFGRYLLIGAGLALFGIGLTTATRAWREDFTEYLACSARTCRRVAPLAKAGYVARGLAYLPLAVLVVLSGVRAEPGRATSFSAALDAVDGQPGGRWILALTALGFIAFGVFSFIEARFRRIRPPRTLSLGD